MVTYRLSRSGGCGFRNARQNLVRAGKELEEKGQSRRSSRRACDVMPLVHVEGPNDPRVAAYRDIPEPELVRARGLFVAEGRLVVERLIEDGRCTIRSLLLSPAAHRSLEPMLTAIPPDTPVYVCEPRDFLGITGFDIHRGCLALAERPAPMATCEILRDARTLVILEGVTNADNVGGVFRNVAALGADAVMLSPTCCDPFYGKAIRTSMAATLRVPFAIVDDWPGGLGDVRATGFTLVAKPCGMPGRLPWMAKSRMAVG